MERSKLKMAWNILFLLVNIFFIVVGVSPIVYAYVISKVPTVPSEPATTAQYLIFACIFIALIITTLEGISGTVQAIGQLIGKEKKGEDRVIVSIDNCK